MRVLVVDDEVRLADGVRRGLEAERWAVGVDGLRHARELTDDAIVPDLVMPGLGGWAVCAQLRADADRTSVLVLTAKDGEWDQVGGRDAGAAGDVTKPFSHPVLVARLRALVRRGAQRPDRRRVRGGRHRSRRRAVRGARARGAHACGRVPARPGVRAGVGRPR